MKRIIRDYLTFNKRERNGVFVLLAIIILLIVYLNISHNFIKEQTVDFTKFEKEVEFLKSSVPEQNLEQKKEIETHATLESERFDFDPNNLPEADWKRLGLSEKQIRTIKNYEVKGGKFRTKEDVRKMYCISEKMYSSLEPFIIISPSPLAGKAIVKKNESTIELNSADSIQLLKLKGIGTFYAKTIINYRSSLGGFVAKEQLMEVWKFDQEKFDQIKDQVTIDNSKIKKININTCTGKELKHPYLKWNEVNAIINYRDKHGKYITIDQIKNTDIINDETYIKIAPYLIIE
ncbi:MAG: helix-hairpin-helix domain-containing protein [Bacteroidota bacterium]